MAKSKFNKETNEGPTVREGVRDLTLRGGEVGKLRSFINTASAGASRRGPALEHEDWHTMCQTICKGVEGCGDSIGDIMRHLVSATDLECLLSRKR